MNSVCLDYLRPLKAKNLIERYEKDFVQREDLTVWRGDNATILPLRRVAGDSLLFGRGGVIDSDGNYVETSAIPKRVDKKYEYKDALYKDSKVVYCGYLTNHWGHFLVEAVARLWYFLEKDKTIDKYVFFIEEDAQREIKGNYKAFFELLQIWDKIEIINRPTTYRQVIVPELGYKYRTYFSEKYKKIFEVIGNNITVDPSWDAPEKIYFSRSQLAKASGVEFGCDALDDFYEKNGYRILFPEKVPLPRMIYYIKNAKICATLSGSLPHNFLFGNDEQKIEIIERCVLNNEIQVDVNIMKRLYVTYVDANISLYPVNMSGPFIMGYNNLLKRYAEDNDMLPPGPEFCTEKHFVKCFKKYMKAYRKEYGFRWYMEDWYVGYADYLWEAYKDGYEQYKDFLSGIRPFSISHYFKLHYIKQMVKRIIRKSH